MQEKATRNTFAEIVASRGDSVFTGKSTALPEGVEGPATPIFGRRDEQPGFQEKLQAAGLAAFPSAGKKIVENLLTADTSDLRGRDIQQFNLVAPDGKRDMFSFIETANEGKGALVNALSGEVMTPETRRELAKKGFKLSRATPQVQQDAAGNIFAFDPILGKRIFQTSTGAPPIPKEKHGTVTNINHPLVPRNVRKDIIQDIQAIRRDPAIKNALKILPQLENVERFLKEDNKVAIDRLGGLTQKLIALDSGNLAAWEQRDPGSRAIITKLRQWARMHASGILIKENKEEMIRVLRITRDNMALNVQDSAGLTINVLTELYPQLNKEALWKKAGLGQFLKRLRGEIDFKNLSGLSDDDLDAQLLKLRTGK